MHSEGFELWWDLRHILGCAQCDFFLAISHCLSADSLGAREAGGTSIFGRIFHQGASDGLDGRF